MTVNELFDQAVVERWQKHADELAQRCMVWAVIAVMAIGTSISLLVLLLTGGLSA